MQVTQVSPMYNRVLVKPKEAEERTPGGVIIPSAHQEEPTEGVVLSVGPLTDECPVTCKAGDIILFEAYAGTKILIDGEPHLVVRADSILGVLEQGAPACDKCTCPKGESE